MTDHSAIQATIDRGRILITKMQPYIDWAREQVKAKDLEARVDEVLIRYTQHRTAMQTTQPETALDKTAAEALQTGFNESAMTLFEKERNHCIELIAQSLRWHVPNDKAVFIAKTIILGADFDAAKAAIDVQAKNPDLAAQLAGAGQLRNLTLNS